MEQRLNGALNKLEPVLFTIKNSVSFLGITAKPADSELKDKLPTVTDSTTSHYAMR